MKTEFLKGMGLEQEVIDKIMAENGKDVEAEKAKTTSKEKELEAASGTISDLQNKIKSFDGPDLEALRKDAEALQQKYDADTKALKEKLSDQAVTSAIDDQIKTLQERKPFLFKGASGDKADGKPSGGAYSPKAGGDPGVTSRTAEIAKARSDATKSDNTHADGWAQK